MERLSLTTPERQLSPAERFELLQQRMEHAIESRSGSCTDVSVKVTHEMTGRPAWINLGVLVKQVRGPQTEVGDVELYAGCGTSANSNNLSFMTISRNSLQAEADNVQAAALSLMEFSVTLAEDHLFGAHLQ